MTSIFCWFQCSHGLLSVYCNLQSNLMNRDCFEAESVLNFRYSYGEDIVTSSIVINVPTRALLVGETKGSFVR